MKRTPLGTPELPGGVQFLGGAKVVEFYEDPWETLLATGLATVPNHSSPGLLRSTKEEEFSFVCQGVLELLLSQRIVRTLEFM